jgi:hypothetical protein
MMRVVFYHVGKGDLSLVLLPNGEAMLVDCYKADEDDRYIPVRRGATNFLPKSGVQVDALCPNRIIDSDEDPNNQCLVLRFSHHERRFLFAGDTQLDDWVNHEYGILRLWPQNVESDVLNVSHHGSRTFFTPPGPREADEPEYEKSDFDVSALKAISPMISFITCSDDPDAEHPHPIALEIYRELTNPSLPANQRPNHVYLSRETRNMHFIVDDDGCVYSRTSRSRCNRDDAAPSSPFLSGTVTSANGFKNPAGIWVVQSQTNQQTLISFSIAKHGPWKRNVELDWRVLNNGQASHLRHCEFYVPPAAASIVGSRKRDLVYHGVHLMQCHARSGDGTQWANWCCPVCFASNLRYAHRWLQLFPNCIDASLINS